MAETMRIFVGTDQRMQKAERALLWSIYKHTSQPFRIVWMRAGDKGWTVGTPAGDLSWDWNIGREAGKPYSRVGWATDFSCFRFAVPELAEFEGRALYVDADMLFLDDPAILWNTETSYPWTSVGHRTDVSLIQCAYFNRQDWPSLEKMRASGWGMRAYLGWMAERHRFKGCDLDAQWDCMDGLGYHPKHTKLIHYTNMRTQPWFPYPDVFDYRVPHRDKRVCEIWHEYYRESQEHAFTDPGGVDVTKGKPLCS